MDNDKPISAVLCESEGGQRLDSVLARLYPDLGLRARRRLWQWCRITLDGREAGPGETVWAGQLLEVVPQDRAQDAAFGLWAELRIIGHSPEYFALSKPGGLPSARIGGAPSRSVEEFVIENWQALRLEDMPDEPPLLCNRLDTPTSGLLLWAFGPLALERFKVLERAGAVKKSYYALVRGSAPEELYLDAALNMAGRKKTLALDEADPDPARHTIARRKSFLKRHGEPVSFMDVLIRRGARHQIRAHLAAAGYPIVGDGLYGGPVADILHLQHYRVAFEGFAAEDPAPEPFKL